MANDPNGNVNRMLPTTTNIHNAHLKPGPQEKRLTEQQELFVREYLVDLNATQAWIRAGGHPTHADRVVTKFMRKGHIVQISIARAMAARATRVGITADRVLQEFARIAFGDPRVVFNNDGSLKAPTEYGEDDAAMIEGVKTRRIVELGINAEGKQIIQQAEIQEVKMASKTGALTQLGRHLGLFNDKLDINVNQPLALRLQAAFKRVGGGPLAIDQDAAAAGFSVEEVFDENEGEAPAELDDEMRRMLE